LSSPEPGPWLDLVVAGDCNPDVLVTGEVTPAFGQRERLVDSMSLLIGGSAAITAVAAARLGLRVALASRGYKGSAREPVTVVSDVKV